jgi:hypothetical protein
MQWLIDLRLDFQIKSQIYPNGKKSLIPSILEEILIKI